MGRPKTYDRETVLRRATDLFWRKGYEGAHLQELIEVTGINRFSLYKEFGGKEGLFREAMQLYLGELSDLGELLAREPLGISNILDLFRAETSDRFPHGCFAMNTIAQRHIAPEASFAQVRGLVEGMERLVQRNLKAAHEAGELRAGLDLSGAVRLVTALNVGLLTYQILRPSKAVRRSVVRSLESMLRAEE